MELSRILEILFDKLVCQTTQSGKTIIPFSLADAIFRKTIQEKKPHITDQELSKIITAYPANARLNMVVDYKKEKEHYDQALKYYDEALELDSKNIDAWLNKSIGE